MTFTKLDQRINSLPLVLAGPMVRRVEPESVSVWVALREARNVRLQVDDPNGIWQSSLTPTWAIGEFLHMVVVTARPPQPMADGTTFNYNLFFEPVTGSGPSLNLFAPGIIAATSNKSQDLLTYPSDPKRTPSFMVPPASLDKLRILHTSCRKIDGEGVDAFPALDHILEDHMQHPATRLRPAMLFLTGDQIYADGSDRELLDVVTDIGDTLLGQEELLPVVERRPSELPKSRTVVAVKDAGLKNPRQYPTLALGEFIALYLLTFSDVLWPPDYHGHDDFRRGLSATRRLFANLATYMIFDDHEVSDSWYASWQWATPLLKSELGRRVLQNALTAYALCQGWGNTPERFERPRTPADKEPPGVVLLKALEQWAKIGFMAGTDPEEQIQRALGIPDVTNFEEAQSDLSHDVFHGPDTLAWHYTVPCKAIAINVLDAYTWKSFDKGEFDPPDHLPVRALDAQVSKIGNQPYALYVASNIVISRYPREGDPTKVADAVVHDFASAVGVIGVVALGLYMANVLLGSLVFWVIVALLAGLLVVGAVAWLKSSDGRIPGLDWLNRAIRAVHFDEIGTEFEWHSPPFERLLDRVARDSAHQIGGQQVSQVLFLSGDIHKSFAMRLSYFADFVGTSPNLRAVFVQLVSSPARYHNESSAAFDDKSSGEFVGWKRTSETEEVEPRTKPAGAEVEWLGKGEFWVARINADLPKFDEGGEHRYRIEPIRPTPQPLEISTLPPHASRTFDDFLSQLGQHEQIMLRQLRFSEIIVANNVADVTFPSSTVVRQDVWWWYSGLGSDPPAWFVKTYEVDITPSQPPSMS